MLLLHEFRATLQEEQNQIDIAEAVKKVCSWILEESTSSGVRNWESLIEHLARRAGVKLKKIDKYGEGSYIMDPARKTIIVPESYSLMTVTAFIFFLPQVIISNCSKKVAGQFSHCILHLIDTEHIDEHELNLQRLQFID